MAKKAMVLKQQKTPKFSTVSTTAARSAAVRTLTCVITVSAVSASVSWLTRVRFRVFARLLGKHKRFKRLYKAAQRKLCGFFAAMIKALLKQILR